MQVTHGLNPGATFLESVFGKRRRKPAMPLPAEGSNTAVAEIAAYIAIRDRYLAEAEEYPTEDALHRARIANDLVRSYVKPARSPYQAQYLPEADAVIERKRCEIVHGRITALADASRVVPSATPAQA